jgi:hypothetical protein
LWENFISIQRAATAIIRDILLGSLEIFECFCRILYVR